jgi:hypothetical protein
MEEKKKFEWVAPEFAYYHKESGWYWLVIILAIFVGAFGIWQGNLMFVFFVAFSAILLIVWGRRQPRNLKFLLDEEGLEILGEKFYPLQNFKGFAIVDAHHDPDYAELILFSKNKATFPLKILFLNGDQEKMRDFLKGHLAEEEYRESLTEGLLRVIKF